MKNIAKSLKADEGAALHFAPGFLYSEWEKAALIGLAVSSHVIEVIVSRQATLVHAKEPISSLIKLLDHRVDPSDSQLFGVARQAEGRHDQGAGS